MLASFRAYDAIRRVVHGERLVSLHSGRYGSESDRVNWGLPACASAFRGEPRRARVPTRRGSVPSPSDPAPLLGGSPDPATGFPKLRGPSGDEYRVLQRVPQMTTMFVIEDEPVLARNLVRAFAREDFHVLHAAGIAEARGIASETPPDVALLDLRLPDGSGLDMLGYLLAQDPDLPVIMMPGYGTVAEAVRAMELGARDYVQKPLDLEELRLRVDRALRSTRQRREISYHRERQAAACKILGESAAIDRLRGMVERVMRMTGAPGAPAPTVLLLGETGSGKGHVARARQAGAGGPVRDGARRHHPARRDRAHLPLAPVEVPEGDRGEGHPTDRCDHAASHRRPGDRRDQPRPRGRDADGRVPGGPLPAALGGRDPHPAAAGTRP